MACNCKNKNKSSQAVKTPIKTNATATTSVNRPSTQQKRIMRREIK